MQIQREQLEPTKIKLTIIAEPSELETVKNHVLNDISANVKVPGFRSGKAPANLVEKQIDPAQLQSQFIDHAVNDLYVAAIDQQRIRPVAQPTINLSKFVPFTTLEFTAEVEAIGAVQLVDYKSIKLKVQPITVTAAEINKVLEDLRGRTASKKIVKRVAKKGDEVVFDFKGFDAKTKEPIDKGDGTDYPLVLGSKTFIPGFEEKLVGLKAGSKKTFALTFPADYQAKELQKRKVNFDVVVHSVNELVKPKLDNKFAASIGPFKTLSELKTDVKKELNNQKKQQAQSNLDNELLEAIATKSTIAVPDVLINEEIDRIEEEDRRNLTYRGQTWQEHLDAEGVTAEEHRTRQRPSAELRIKAGIILGEVAEAENIKVSPEELEVRLQLLRGQYATDSNMLAELDKPEGQRDIRNRLLTEKTLDKLRSYAIKQ